MATYVFLNIPAHGHVNPTLAVVHELVQRGEKVIYYLTEEFRPTIEATGATFRPYRSLMPNMQLPTNFDPGQGPLPMNSMPMKMVEEGQNVLPQVFQSIKVEEPDYIVYDMMCMWAKIVARSLHIPAILLRPSYAPSERNSLFMARNMAGGGGGGGAPSPFIRPANNEATSATQPAAAQALSSDAGSPPAAQGFFAAFGRINESLAELCRQYNVEPFAMLEIFFGVEPLTIVFVPKEFQPNGDTYDKRFVFVGPSIEPRVDNSNFPLEKLQGKTVLYISLGTVFNNRSEFYNMCFAAFKDEPWLVVLSTGKAVHASDLDAVPDNFLVSPQVPQLEVLQHTTLFVSHCGMNSTMESLYYGVPLVCVPQMPEQMMTANRIQELELGTTLDRNALTVDTLRSSVEQAMANEQYRVNTQAMREHVRNAGGYRRAADAIMEFERNH